MAMTDKRLAEIEKLTKPESTHYGTHIHQEMLLELTKEIRQLRQENERLSNKYTDAMSAIAALSEKLRNIPPSDSVFAERITTLKKENAKLRKVVEAARLFLYSEDESADIDMENCERNYENLEQVVDEHLVRIRSLKLRSLRFALRELDDEANHE